MTVLLRRWHTPTLTETVTPMRTTCFGCARCGGLVPAHLAERDPLSGEFVHTGNCPYVAKVTFPFEPVAPQKSRAQQMREEQAERQKRLRQVRALSPSKPPAVRPPIIAPDKPTPEQIRLIHEDARKRAEERQRAQQTTG